MPKKWKTRSSNLFHIDLDVVEKSLADANASLLESAEAMIKEANRFSDHLTNVEDAERLKTFVKTLRAQQREIRSARLSDGRPFTDAAGFVKEWFGKTENKLKAADTRLSTILRDYTFAAQKKADEVRKRNAELQACQNHQTNEDSPVVGTSVSGTPVVTVNRPPNEKDVVEFEKVPEAPNVDLVWQVKSFDRNSIDLEELRLFLSDHAIRLAINSHIKAKGPKQLQGVIYEQVIANKL